MKNAFKIILIFSILCNIVLGTLCIINTKKKAAYEHQTFINYVMLIDNIDKTIGEMIHRKDGLHHFAFNVSYLNKLNSEASYLLSMNNDYWDINTLK